MFSAMQHVKDIRFNQAEKLINWTTKISTKIMYFNPIKLFH